MTFTGPDRAADRSGEDGGGLGVPRRTKVLVAVALLGATFWAGWWARGKLTRDEGTTSAVAGGERATRAATNSEASVVVFEGTLHAGDAASGTVPDVTPAAMGADVTGPSPSSADGITPDAGTLPGGAPAHDAIGAGGDVGGFGTPGSDAERSPAPDGPERMTWSVDRDGIQGAVREAVPDIRECYEAWLRANPALAGKVTVRFTIATDPDDAERGKVTRAALVASDVNHPLMEGCVLNVMAGLAFEAPSDGKPLDVNYPIILQTEP